MFLSSIKCPSGNLRSEFWLNQITVFKDAEHTRCFQSQRHDSSCLHNNSSCSSKLQRYKSDRIPISFISLQLPFYSSKCWFLLTKNIYQSIQIKSASHMTGWCEIITWGQPFIWMLDQSQWTFITLSMIFVLELKLS